MTEYSSTQLANVQNFLLYKGHARPTIDKDHVHFIDQSKGNHRFVNKLTIAEVLEEIMMLRKVDIDDFTDKSAFAAGSYRYGIDRYQVMEIKGKIIYREDFRAERQQKAL